MLTIVAAAMVTQAFSAGFDFLYPIRVVAVAAVLLYYRRDCSARYDSPRRGRRWRRRAGLRGLDCDRSCRPRRRRSVRERFSCDVASNCDGLDSVPDSRDCHGTHCRGVGVPRLRHSKVNLADFESCHQAPSPGSRSRCPRFCSEHCTAIGWQALSRASPSPLPSIVAASVGRRRRACDRQRVAGRLCARDSWLVAVELGT